MTEPLKIIFLDIDDEPKRFDVMLHSPWFFGIHPGLGLNRVAAEKVIAFLQEE